MDIGLNTITGDLDLDGGLKLVTGVEELKQRLSVGLTINLSEFFTHQNYGLPWLREEGSDTDDDVQYFLGDSDTTVQYVISAIDDYILSLDQVTEVTSTFTYTGSDRSIVYIPTITAEDGEVVDFPPYTLFI